MNIVLSSKVSKDSREALEDLLYFNPRQHVVREGIVEVVQKFGKPRVVESGDGLSIQVGEQPAQALFAFDLDGDRDVPVGLVVFLRTQPDEVAIMHMAVDADYALKGRQAGMGLGVVLMEQVKDLCRRIVGVKKIALSYRRGIVIRL